MTIFFVILRGLCPEESFLNIFIKGPNNFKAEPLRISYTIKKRFLTTLLNDKRNVIRRRVMTEESLELLSRFLTVIPNDTAGIYQ